MEVPQNDIATLVALVELLSQSSGLEFQARVILAEPSPAPGQPAILIDLSGRDAPALLANHGELLDAIESIAADILGLDDADRHRISFDSGKFRSSRENNLRRMADAAVDGVRSTAIPHIFPPLNSRDRRHLHLAIAGSGLSSESIGAEPTRHVVLYPEYTEDAPPAISTECVSAHPCA